MQFFAVAALFAATVAAVDYSNGTLTTQTVYTTQRFTITSCAPTVTNCPASSTVVVTSKIALYTTVCPVSQATSVPVKASPSAAYVAPLYTVKTVAVPAVAPGTKTFTVASPQSTAVYVSGTKTFTVASPKSTSVYVSVVKNPIPAYVSTITYAAPAATPVAPGSNPAVPGASAPGVAAPGSAAPGTPGAAAPGAPGAAPPAAVGTGAVVATTAAPAPATFTGAAYKVGGSMGAAAAVAVAALLL